jgi:hypothetical protein
MTRRNLLCIFFLLLMLLTPADPVHAQAGVLFGQTTIENSYPDSLSFQVTAQSSETITGARFYFKLRGESTETRNDLTVTPGNRVDLAYQ